MKNLRNLLLSVLLFGNLTPLFAYQVVNQEKNRLIQVNPTEVIINEEGIFIIEDGQWIRVNALYSKPNGLFIKKTPVEETWTCMRCGYYNSRGGSRCSNCGAKK